MVIYALAPITSNLDRFAFLGAFGAGFTSVEANHEGRDTRFSANLDQGHSAAKLFWVAVGRNNQSIRHHSRTRLGPHPARCPS